jgi:hypothetical protein
MHRIREASVNAPGTVNDAIFPLLKKGRIKVVMILCSAK